MIQTTMVRILLITSMVVLLVTPGAFAADADTGSNFNLTSSPLAVNLAARPGATVTTPLRVQNTGDQSETINVSLQKFGAFGTGGMPTIEAPSESDDFIKWASFSKTSFKAEPGQWTDITMTLKVPRTAAFGYYYAVVFSTDQKRPEFTDGRRTGVNGAVASLVLLDVNALGAKRELTIEDFISVKKIYEYAPASFEIKVKNPGNVHTIPSGNIFISRSAGSEILSTLSINPGQGNVLPGSERLFTVNWDDGWPVFADKRINGQVISDEDGKPVKQLDWSSNNLNKFRFGKYTASVTLVYNDGTNDVPIEGTVSFWIIPWKILGVSLIVLLLVLYAFYVLGRNIVRRLRRGGRKSEPKA